jgi:hypothetical protein
MPRNGSGVYALVTTPFATAGAIAVASTINANINDLGTEITGSLPVNGSKGMAAALTMGTNKITGLAVGTAATDAPTLGQAQSGIVAQATAVGGTVDAIALTFSPVFTAYTSGMRVRWISGGVNTITAPTVAIDTMATKIVKRAASVALVAGDTGASGKMNEAVYNGTDFLLLNSTTQLAADLPAASLTAQGAVELATTTETITGTDATRAATPDGLAALWEAGSDNADGAAITLGEGGYFNLITSTTAITSFAFTTDKAGRRAHIRFNTARTLTHNATSLIIPGAENITTAAGDIMGIRSLGSGNFAVEWYSKASGAPVNLAAYTEYDLGVLNDDSITNQAHGLGRYPSSVEWYLENDTTDAGYAAGDRVHFAACGINNSDTGLHTYESTTNVGVVVSANVYLTGKASFNATALTLANWSVIVRVYR